MNNLPIITLEVDRMRLTMKTMLAQHAALLDTSVQKAVDEFCTPGNIDAIVREAAKRELDIAVKEEVRNFFAYSAAGRQAVREAVTEHLNEVYGPKKGE